MSIKVVKSRGKSKIVSIRVDYRKDLNQTEPYRPLLRSIKQNPARNNQGRVTVRSRSGPSHRRLYRIVDFSRLDRKNVPGRVESIEYDPNRTAFIMLVVYRDGERRYHLAPTGVKVDDEVIMSESAGLKPGNRLSLKNILPGTEVCEVEMTPAGKGKFGRSAGSKITIMGFDEKYCLLKMPSAEVRKVSKDCYATIGSVSNQDHRNVRIGKAGRNRWLGRRPHVRGSAMNTRDHPYGGGKGKMGLGRRKLKTRSGKVTAGHRTRHRKKPSSRLIVRRRK